MTDTIPAAPLAERLSRVIPLLARQHTPVSQRAVDHGCSIVAHRMVAWFGGSYATWHRAVQRILHENRTIGIDRADQVCTAMGWDMYEIWPELAMECAG